MADCVMPVPCVARVDTFPGGYVLGGLCYACLDRVMARREAAESPKKWWKRRRKKWKRSAR